MENGFRQLTEQDLNTLSTSPQVELGAQGNTSDGRTYVYVGYSGTSSIGSGQLCIAPAHTTAYVGLAITATTIAAANQTTANLTAGSLQLVLTNGATAITQDQFAQGYLEVTSGNGNGPTVYKISGNVAAAASGYVTVYLNQSEPLRNSAVLVPGTDVATLYVGPYNGVAPSTTIGQSVGVTPMLIPNTASVTNYGWLQTSGLTWLTNDAGGTLTVGEGIAQSSTVAGSVVAVAATTFQVGQTQRAISASTSGPCVIHLL